MKSVTIFAFAVLFCVPAMAQFGGMGVGGGNSTTQAKGIETEILEMEQEADKAALKEALLLWARQGMKLEAEGQKNLSNEHATNLREFIAKKKEAITARSAEMTKIRVAKATPAGQPPQIDWKSVIEKSENAKVEVQLLQAKLAILGDSLSHSIQKLVQAELAASKDEAQRDKAVVARKEYGKIKAMHVELSSQLRLEQQQTGGMGGGFQ